MVVKRLCFVVLLLFQYGWGQNIDNDYVLEENRKAINLNREGKFLEANTLLQSLLSKLQEENSKENLFALTYQTKAKIVQSLGNYEESNLLARKSLQISVKLFDSVKIADNFNTIGINHYFQSDYDSTTFYYEKSLEIKRKIKTNPYALAVSTYNLALVYDDLGQTERALELYYQSETLLLESKQEKNFLSDVYVGMALIHFYSGDLSKAEIYVEKALEKGLASYGEFNPNMTFVYTTYANILEAKKEYEAAIDLLEKNLKIRRESYGEWHRWTCETNYDLANSYVLVKKYDKAEDHYLKAIEIGKRINSRQYLANARNFLGQLYLDRRIHLDKAQNLLHLALETNREIYGEVSDLVAENYLQLAKLYQVKAEGKEFLKYIELCLNASNYRDDRPNEVIGPLQAIGALMLLTDYYLNEFERNGKVETLKNSYEQIDKKMELIKLTQSNFSSDRSRIDFANKYREVFEKDLGICWLLYHSTRDQKYLEKAFELSETNRNTTLLRGLQGIKFMSFSDIPKEKQEMERSVKKELERVKMDLYFEKTASNPDKEYYQSMLDLRIILTNRLDSIYMDFEKNYPKFNNSVNSNSIVKIEEVQEILDLDAQVLTYFLGDESLFSFTITKDTVSLLRADIAPKLIEITSDFKNHLSKREEIDELSYDLYMYLLGQQLDKNKSDLIIIPDNVLNYIPFEVLKTPKDSYLIEDYSVSYNGSVSLYLELQNEFFNYKTAMNWAGFAPDYYESKSLSHAQTEIDEISRITNGTKFTDGSAIKSNFTANSKEFSILHLAMHAEIDNDNPMNNSLLFDDGPLRASEIYTMKSNANLAVLSACNTGFGKIEKGEGVMSMARAFHFSGVPSIVMSLWKIPDKQTKSVMIDFYKYLKRGDKKSHALKQAKINYLNKNSNTALAHPYYWSGFVLNGNIEALDLQNSTPPIIWILIGLMGLGILLVGLKKLKENYSK